MQWWVVVLVLVRYYRFFFGWLWLVAFVVPSSAGLVKLHTVVNVKKLSEKLKQMCANVVTFSMCSACRFTIRFIAVIARFEGLLVVEKVVGVMRFLC